VIIDYGAALKNSAIGKAELGGASVSSFVEIKSVVPEEGCMIVNTDLNMPDNVKKMVYRIVGKEED
jgi:hypothetical protein